MKRIAIFASGTGSNFEVITRAFENGELNAIPVVCVCDKYGAPVIEKARNHNIPVIVSSPKEFSSKEDFEKNIVRQLKQLEIDLICLAGYMRIVGDSLLAQFPNRIVNIHPSLLPAFKGAHAIKDAFEYGVKVYGVTIHYVDETLDGGKIIEQEAFKYEGNDISELENKIHKIEHKLYPITINKIISTL